MELEEEGQYSRLMPKHHLDDPMAYRNFIQMPPELCQELEQRIAAEFQRDRTLMRDVQGSSESRGEVGNNPQTSCHW